MKVKTQPQKSLGQNFLTDRGILKKIADFAQIKNTDTVVEVGPGEGTLTEFILERAAKVIAIEKDERLVELLNLKFEKEIAVGKLQIMVGDILELTLSSQLSALSYIMVGNIPYYITGALFKKVLGAENSPKSITFVVQKEVAERIVARDGKESILSISIKAYGDPKYGGVIKAGSFYPKPKVDSAIIRIENISKEKFVVVEQKSLVKKVWPSEARRPEDFLNKSFSVPQHDISVSEQKFFEILKAGFAHKRKLLIKNLGGVIKKEKLKEIFEKCKISEKARAEDLKVDDWFSILKYQTLI